MIVMVVTTIVPGALMIESLSRRKKLTGTVLSSPGAPPWQSAADLFQFSRAVGLMAVSPGNRVLWANERCRELLEMDRSGDGFPLGSVTSLPESVRLRKEPAPSEYETGLVRLRSMTGDTAGVTMEVFPWVRDGEVRMRLFCFTLPSQGEAVSRRTGINAHGEALEAGSGTEARMAESIMHDMNNHLSGIIGSASLELDRSGGEDGYRLILESAEKLSALCSDLNAILSGEEDPSLRDVMEETSLIAEVMRRILPDGVGFSVTGGTTKLIGVKRESLRNLLYNLALNSTEMMSGEGRIRVDISERIPPGAGGLGSVSPGGKICMRYSDGYIMPVALRDVLSGRKYSVPDVERQFGTTIGAVYRALGETGAEVRFERGSGETVLCMVMKGYERERTTGEDPSRPPEYPGMAGLSVLVAEEVEIVLHSNCEYLEHRGMVTTPVTDGDKAMDMLRHGRFDAAVLDLSMPGVPTPSIVRYCQTSLPGMAVVITTGYGMNDQIRDLLKAPSTDCLYKPHRPEVLVETIYSTLMRIQEGEHT
ncbi:MAG TPA: response regulator [Candidatus Sabulitectum sp.]|nr:response regulator [Candidatus Sabulitectum sp.]